MEMEAAFDDLVKCPWCPSGHDVVQKRLEIHYSKLKQNKDPCVRHLRTCRFNSHHKFHKKEEDKHYAECEDGKQWAVREALCEEYRQSQPPTIATHSQHYGEDEENWDTPAETLQHRAPRSFRVLDDYRSVYQDTQPAESVSNAADKAKRREEAEGIEKKSESRAAKNKAKKPTTQTSQQTSQQTAAKQTEVEQATTVPTPEPVDPKKLVRKLEKKLKEIKKLEEKAKKDLTKEELEKISKRCDIETELAALKL